MSDFVIHTTTNNNDFRIVPFFNMNGITTAITAGDFTPVGDINVPSGYLMDSDHTYHLKQISVNSINPDNVIGPDSSINLTLDGSTLTFRGAGASSKYGSAGPLYTLSGEWLNTGLKNGGTLNLTVTNPERPSSLIVKSPNTLICDLVDLPADVICNFKADPNTIFHNDGGNLVNLYLKGNLQSGDTVTVKRSWRADSTFTIDNPLNNKELLIALGATPNGSGKIEVIYKHLNPTTTPAPTTPATPTPTPAPKKVPIYPVLQNAQITTPSATVTTDPTSKKTSTDYYLTASDPQQIILKATAGYSFENAGSLTWSTSDSIGSNSQTIPATHTDTVTINLPSFDWSHLEYITVKMGAIQAQVVGNTGGFVNLYLANYSDLLKFSSDTIFKINSSGGTEVYDVTPYLDSLIMLPFDLPSNMVDSASSIIAGNRSYQTQLPTINDNQLNVDLGTITIDENYKNGYDYQGEARLILPFTSYIDFNVKDIMNHSLSIKYNVELTSGDTTIIVTRDNEPLTQNKVNLATIVPYITKSTHGDQIAEINKYRTIYNNDVHTAQLVLTQPQPILNNDYYSTIEQGMLKDYNGNVRVKLLDTDQIAIEDLTDLQSILESGVKIK